MKLGPYAGGRIALWALELAGWFCLVFAALSLYDAVISPSNSLLLIAAVSIAGSVTAIAMSRVGLAVFDIAESTASTAEATRKPPSTGFLSGVR